MVYTSLVLNVIESATFRRWIRGLRDQKAIARINARLRNASLGNLGDIRPIRGGLVEMRVHYGPGYRLYCIQDGEQVVLLCGGDKDSQQRDIELANSLLKDWRLK